MRTSRRADGAMGRALRGQRGVTLVELMVVVAITAIIAAIALTLYQDIQRKARLAADRGTIGALRSAIALYYAQHNGNFPADPANYVQAASPLFQCTGLTTSYDAATGILSITSTNTIADCP